MSVFNIETREQLIQELFPDGEPEKMSSYPLFDDNPQEWSITMKRQLEVGIQSADEEQVKAIIREISCIVGIDNALMVYWMIWGDMVEEEIREGNKQVLGEANQQSVA